MNVRGAFASSARVRGLSVAVGAAAIPAALHLGGIADLTAPASLHPAVVAVCAACAVGAALVAARVLRLTELGSRFLPPPRPATEMLDEMADLAGVARSQGLLPVIADPRAREHPVLLSGLHLLIRDADERLIRSSLEAEAERLNASSGDRAGTVVAAIRGLTIGLVMAAGAAAIIMATAADSPGSLGAWGGLGALGATLGCFVWLGVSRPLALNAQRRNAAGVFARMAAVEVIEAVRLGEDRAMAAARLAGLMPGERTGGVSERMVARRAA